MKQEIYRVGANGYYLFGIDKNCRAFFTNRRKSVFFWGRKNDWEQ